MHLFYSYIVVLSLKASVPFLHITLTLTCSEAALVTQAISYHICYFNVSKFLDQFSSVAQSCLTLCYPMNRSTPGLPVHHQLPEFTQTHVYQVSDTIQPSYPLSSPSPRTPNSPKIRVFSNKSTLCMRWPKYWSFRFSISLPMNIQD